MSVMSLLLLFTSISLLTKCNGYKAAVIEHHSIIPTVPILTVSDAEDVMNANLNKLEPNIISAAQRGADLVLLSEMAITSLIKDRNTMHKFLYELGDVHQGTNSTACNNPLFNDRPILQRISCLAKKNGIYLAVNWGDIVPCHRVTDRECPSDGHYQYNTEIVFDSKGEMVAKYWKIHTFTATEFDTPKKEQYQYFTMDDGTKIGIITCFDSMYATPLLPLIHSEGISDFIVSHWWNNQYAMFSAAQWWQALSRRMKINVMAAATWWVPTTDQVPWSSGSGIYSSGHVLASWYNQDRSPIDKLLIANVSRSNGPANDLPEFRGYGSLPAAPAPMCSDSKHWDHVEVGRKYHGTVQCGPFTCSVDFEVEKVDHEQNEHWFLYTDTGYYFQADGNDIYYEEQFCSFYKCYDASGCLTTAGHTADDTGHTVFDHIRISGDFLPGSVTMAMASGGDGDVYKDIMEKVHISEKDGVTTADASKVHDVLINLSVIGRKYSLDAKVEEE